MKAHPPIAVVVLALVGCCETRLCRRPPHLPAETACVLGEAGYALGCADVLEVAFADRPEWDCAASVGLDGRLPLGDAGNPPVQGLSLDAARAAVAVAAKVEPGRVTVALADARAGRVYVTGPENKLRRTVPFRGPEPVLEFLWRAGAMKPGSAELRDVKVLRPNVAAGGKPEAFEVDAAAIVLGGDHRSNVVLRASDEVVVGETRRSSFARLVPDWALPFYRRLVGLLPPDAWPW